MKKVLAWAVVLALVFSSFTMAFAADKKAASDFSDYDSIQYKEAVDVMVATGVINGYPDGTFGPTKDVKRSESAKMIAVMLNGGKDIGDEYKGSCTFADSKDHWAAGYIAYCSATQPVIINGRSADVFDPEGSVTGTELAKMALCALGYDPQIQGYTGDQWSASVLRDADKVGLFDGLADDFVPGEPCSREETAQILFNCLKGTMVEYDTTTSVTVGDATVTVNSKVQDQTWPEGSPKDDNGNGTKELYESVFDGKLSETNEYADDYGRPTHSWFYDEEEVGSYEADPDDTFVAEDTYDDADEALEEINKDYMSFNVTLNGDRVGYIDTIRVRTGLISYQEVDCILDYDILPGDQIEMYKVSKNLYDVVILRYSADRIESVDTEVSTSDAEDGIKAYVDLEFNGLKKIDSEDPSEALPGYDADTYVEDAVIAVAAGGSYYTENQWASAWRDLPGNPDYVELPWYGGNVVLDSYALEKETTDEWTKNNRTKITVGGTAYDKLSSFVNFDQAVVGDDVDLYLINDYAAAIVNASEAPAAYYGVATGTYTSSGFDPETTIRMITQEGEQEDIVVDSECPIPEVLQGLNAKDVSDDILVKYTLTGKVIDSIVVCEGYDSIYQEKVKTGNILAGMKVSKDIVAFYYDEDAEEYKVYGFDEVKAADSVTALSSALGAFYSGNTAYYYSKDDNLAAILLEEDAVATEDIIGIIADADISQVKDGKYEAVVTAFIDGTAEYYDTVAFEFDSDLYDFLIAPSYWRYYHPVKFVLKEDGTLKTIKELNEDLHEECALVSEFGENCDYAAAWAWIYEKDKDDLLLRTAAQAQVWQPVADSAFYYVDSNGDLKIVKFSAINVNDDPEAKFIQTDKDAESWNIVVYEDDSSADIWYSGE
jgi:hypothetical protein